MKALNWQCGVGAGQAPSHCQGSGSARTVAPVPFVQWVQTRLTLRGRDGQPQPTIDRPVAWMPGQILPPAQGQERPEVPQAGGGLRGWQATRAKHRLEWGVFSTGAIANVDNALMPVGEVGFAYKISVGGITC